MFSIVYYVNISYIGTGYIYCSLQIFIFIYCVPVFIEFSSKSGLCGELELALELQKHQKPASASINLNIYIDLHFS